MPRHTKAVAAASERVVEALEQAIKDPSTEHNRLAAESIVQLRRHFTFDGLPDWAGRSPEYRDVIERLYRRANVPSDSESKMQANLRYHLGNILRKVAPTEELAALGMSVEGPLGRIRSKRAMTPTVERKRKQVPAAVRTVTVGDPNLLITLALDAVRTVGSCELAEVADEVEVGLRQLLDETVSVLTGLRPATSSD